MYHLEKEASRREQPEKSRRTPEKKTQDEFQKQFNINHQGPVAL
jgi:hypothetical protein